MEVLYSSKPFYLIKGIRNYKNFLNNRNPIEESTYFRLSAKSVNTWTVAYAITWNDNGGNPKNVTMSKNGNEYIFDYDNRNYILSIDIANEKARKR